MTFIFDKLAPPPQIYVSNDALNHFLVNYNAKNSLRRAKNVVFFYSAFWLTGQWGAIAPPWLRYCVSQTIRGIFYPKSLQQVLLLFFFNSMG